ncbi:MAG: hypothetical protein ACI8U3_001506 [Brevundimonas sp.]|jgi:hypothetical protein|uniref:hypothetical protein n=1 Tax=Brevundimonas sp. TaxID=1871086 RepID=UPI0039E21662
MFKPQKAIPSWYQRDWSPASGSDELPQLQWSDVLQVVHDLAPNKTRAEATTSLFQRLRSEADNHSPMDLLQQVLICASTLMKPQTPVLFVAPPRSLPVQMPRWSCTDVEVALSYSCSGMELVLAQHRYNDLLRRYGAWGPRKEVLRSLFLIVMGLSISAEMELRKEAARAICRAA